MRVAQNEKAVRFRALHEGPGVFVIPNPWDVSSARVLAGLGFHALATSSAASAAALGRRDGGVTREFDFRCDRFAGVCGSGRRVW